MDGQHGDGLWGGDGMAGVDALSPATDGPRKIINLDADSTPPIDLSIYFTGGKETITYSVKVTRRQTV